MTRNHEQMSDRMTKPAAKEQAPVAIAPRSRKGTSIGIALLVAILAGAGIYLIRDRILTAGQAEAAKAEMQREPKFIALGENFTVNLQREEGDHSLQAAITLKVQPELEKKVKAAMPEIRSKLLLLLSSKKPSELMSQEGKKKLIAEARVETSAALGLGSAPSIEAVPAQKAMQENVAQAGGAASAPAATPIAASSVPAAPVTASRSVATVDVLFTTFFIR